MVFFIGAFVILRFVHPSFQLVGSTPYIILLAFVILVLGLVVLFIVMGKFSQEVQKVKRASAGVHEVDVGRLSATTAAVLLGISNLRRRRLRTGLTATTLAWPEADAVVPRTGEKVHPLCALYRREPVRTVARRRLAAGELALVGLLEELNVSYLGGSDLHAVDPDGSALFNANTPEEFARLQGR